MPRLCGHGHATLVRHGQRSGDRRTGRSTLTRPLNALFLCTGNSARSILAEAVLNQLAIGDGKFRAYSAGSHPKGQVHPLALELLQAQGLPTAGLRSKSWDEFAGPDAPMLDFVFTVCDQAAGEACPFWPGHPVTGHWGIPDPAAVEGTDDTKRRAFKNAFLILHRRIELFASLPLHTLSGAALRREIDRIGLEPAVPADSTG